MYHGERFNAYSHLAGFLLAVAALVLMLVKAVESADGYRIAGALTYGICLLLLYLGSTLYQYSAAESQGDFAKGRSLHDLSFDCRQLYTVYADYPAGRLGLVAFRRVVGAGFAGHCSGTDDRAQKRETAAVDGDLCVDGLADCGGGVAADKIAFGGRIILAGVGRRVV